MKRRSKVLIAFVVGSVVGVFVPFLLFTLAALRPDHAPASRNILEKLICPPILLMPTGMPGILVVLMNGAIYAICFYLFSYFIPRPRTS